MDVKGPLKKYGRIASVKVDASVIRRSIEIITASGIEHEFRTTVVRSQLAMDDLISISKLLKKADLYVLQSFVPAKIIDNSFLSETSYSQEEFGAIHKKLERGSLRLLVR
jgi:pyruvate formate lyase activating enzyme